MILVTRLNGPGFALNPDLIERAESTPDTVITLVDGSKFVVAESVAELIDRIRDFRASVIASARAFEIAQEFDPPQLRPSSGSQVVPLHKREV